MNGTEPLLFSLQGEKGEPGLIIGPDGNPQYLDGLSGLKVSSTALDRLHVEFYV